MKTPLGKPGATESSFQSTARNPPFPSNSPTLSHSARMDVTQTAFGSWNGGRFMHYGQPLEDARWIEVARNAHQAGIRTFLTADVYGAGEADTLLGRALEGLPRDSYCLVGTVGHDIYRGKRDGAKGYPRFTHSSLRRPADYADYLRMATEKSLARCGVDRFDLLLLHNPDSVGYTSDHVWKGMQRLVDAGLVDRLGVAPGPANGFTLDIIQCFERFGSLIDWAMIILNPLEPWPGNLILSAAEAHQVDLITRVVDYGGLFHDDVRPGHVFGTSDHRLFRPPGWVDVGMAKLEAFRPIAERHGLTLLQFACAWNLHQARVKCVVPTLIEEVGGGKSIDQKVLDLAAVRSVTFSPAELAEIDQIGNNRGCMHLKGAKRGHSGYPEADQWGLTPDLESVAARWKIDPDADLAFTHG